MRVLYLLLVTAFFSIEANAVPRNCHWIEYLGGYDYDLGNCAGNPQLTKSVDHHVLCTRFIKVVISPTNFATLSRLRMEAVLI